MEVTFVSIRPVRPPPKIGETPENTSNLISNRRLRIIVVRRGNCLKCVVDRVENRVQRMQAIRACVASIVRRDLKEPVAPVRKVSRGKGNFPLASIPVTDIPRSYSFYSSVMSDESGRSFARGNYGKHRRQEIDSAQRIRNNKLRGGKENTATRTPRRQ